MIEIIDNLFVGDDKTYEKIEDKSGWSVLRCCKEGPDGHRQLLGYKTPGAPKGKDYLSVRHKNLLALNMLDIDDPNFFSDEMINHGLDFIEERIKAGDKVLVACNQGRSRGPSMALMYMRRVGELPVGYRNGYRIFKTLYPKYDPGLGIEHYVKSHYNNLNKG